VQAFGDLALAEGTDRIDAREKALGTALDSLREARDRIDDLQLIDAGPDDGGWELSTPVQQTVERVLRDLDPQEQAHRRKAPAIPTPRVDALEVIKSAQQLWRASAKPAAPQGRPVPKRTDRRTSDRREIPADLTGPHRLPRTSRGGANPSGSRDGGAARTTQRRSAPRR